MHARVDPTALKGVISGSGMVVLEGLIRQEIDSGPRMINCRVSKWYIFLKEVIKL